MKRYLHTALAVCMFFVAACANGKQPSNESPNNAAQQAAKGQKARYIFYFIGDGMGVNHVNVAETYLAAIEGRNGIKPLCFASFPYTAMVTTQSASSNVTDSAAGGTALATGHKTKNGALGLDSLLEKPVNSIAWLAQQNGYAVGVTTTVTTDHATPAAFFAHTKARGNTKEIRQQRSECGYDFIMGAEDGSDLCYRLDRLSGHTGDRQVVLCQADIVRMAIDSLSRGGLKAPAAKGKKGKPAPFFLMSEGGMIDWAAHDNDAATMIGEIQDMDDAVRLAYEFYEKYPDETLIVISADHETGGLVMGAGKYELHLDRLQHQRMSISRLGKELHQMRKEAGENYSWDMVKAFLKENFGFWDKLQLTDKQTERLQTAFQRIQEGKGATEKTLYQMDDELAVAVKRTMSEQAMLSFATGAHSAGYVPCYAIGVGAEQFTGRIDNTEIPQKMAKAAGWTLK